MDCREDSGKATSGQWIDPNTWRFPEVYWDNLSTMHVDFASLQELDRRVLQQKEALKSQNLNKKAEPATRTAGVLPTSACDLARFGGPDLSHVRGYGYYEYLPCPPQYSGLTKDRKWPTSTSSFEQHLQDHGIRSLDTSRPPANLAAIQAALAVGRPAAERTDGTLSKGAFARFCRAQKPPVKLQESPAARNARFDILTGAPGIAAQGICTSAACSFANLRRLTDATVPAPWVDVCDGAAPEQLGAWLLGELCDLVEPAEGTVLVPNFFYEFDRSRLPKRWMERVACYESAYGARAMHVLQGQAGGAAQAAQAAQGWSDEALRRLPLDYCAYTLSAVYHDDTLSVYAHHVTAGRTLEYHMTLVGTYAVTASYGAFVEAATALRNARDVAKQWRDVFLAAAQARRTPEQVAYDDEAQALQAMTKVSFRQVNAAMAAKRQQVV